MDAVTTVGVIAGGVVVLAVVVRKLQARRPSPEERYKELLGPAGLAAVERNRAASQAKWEAMRLDAATKAADNLRSEGNFAGAEQMDAYLRILPAGKEAPGAGELLEGKDEALANKIKRLLMSGSFHDSRDSRAYRSLSAQLDEIGKSIRASGRERWDRIMERVKFLCGEHSVGLSKYYDLLGEAPVPSPAGPSGAAFEILFGQRTVDRLGSAPRASDDLPAFLAPDVASLAALPEQQTKCVFKCCHIIPSRPRPEREAIQAWAAALGSDVERALGGVPARQVLASVAETGELVLYVFWDNGVSRAQVERLGTAMQAFLIPGAEFDSGSDATVEP